MPISAHAGHTGVPRSIHPVGVSHRGSNISAKPPFDRHNSPEKIDISGLVYIILQFTRMLLFSEVSRRHNGSYLVSANKC